MLTVVENLTKAYFVCAVALLTALAPSGWSRADDTNSDLAKTHKEIEQAFGKTPEFIKAFPAAGLPGAWSEVKAIELDPNTALSPKEKALISLAVAAQIPCQYCIWHDTQDARRAGATDEEIKEAVALSAIERHWSTVLNGMQVDFATFKRDMGGDAPVPQQ